MSKKKFEIGEDGWVHEIGELRIPPEKPEKIKVRKQRKRRCNNPKYVSSALNEVEQEAFERLMKRYNGNTSDVIRRSIVELDMLLRISEGEDPKGILQEGTR